MVRHTGSPTGIVHADMTLARSKVKVTDLLKFRKSPRWPSCKIAIVTAGRPQQAMHTGGDDRQPACMAFLYL